MAKALFVVWGLLRGSEGSGIENAMKADVGLLGANWDLENFIGKGTERLIEDETQHRASQLNGQLLCCLL